MRVPIIQHDIGVSHRDTVDDMIRKGREEEKVVLPFSRFEMSRWKCSGMRT